MGALVIGSRIWVGYGFDMAKARKATVVDIERSAPNASRAVNRPVIRLDGETATLTLPGNAFEITCRSMLVLGAVKDEG
jgi:hypothetical protein